MNGRFISKDEHLRVIFQVQQQTSQLTEKLIQERQTYQRIFGASFFLTKHNAFLRFFKLIMTGVKRIFILYQSLFWIMFAPCKLCTLICFVIQELHQALELSKNPFNLTMHNKNAIRDEKAFTVSCPLFCFFRLL